MGIRQISHPARVRGSGRSSSRPWWHPERSAGAGLRRRPRRLMAAICAVFIVEPPRAGAGDRCRGSAREPVSRRRDAGPHPSRVGAARRAAVRARDVRAGVADRRPGLGSARGGRRSSRSPRSWARSGGSAPACSATGSEPPAPAALGRARRHPVAAADRLAPAQLHLAPARRRDLSCSRAACRSPTTASRSPPSPRSRGALVGPRARRAEHRAVPVAAAVAPLVGALIGVVGYSAAFALIALAPLMAVPLIPRDR